VIHIPTQGKKGKKDSKLIARRRDDMGKRRGRTGKDRVLFERRSKKKIMNAGQRPRRGKTNRAHGQMPLASLHTREEATPRPAPRGKRKGVSLAAPKKRRKAKDCNQK